MRRWALGGVLTAVVATGWAWAAAAPGDRAPAGPAFPVPAAGNGLSAMSWSAPDGGQMLALVDPALRSVCVYQIKPTGEIALKSVRNVNWDLQMLEFNTDSPAPREIQTLLNHR